MRFTSLMLALMALATLSGRADPAVARAEDKDKSSPNVQYINISPIAAPIVVNGKLINYVFLAVRLDLASNVDVSKLRDKEPFFRDALVRAAYRKPFVKPGDYTHIDEKALIAAMMAASERIAGPHAVTQVEILSAQPQKVTGFPRSGAALPPLRSPIP